MADLKVSAPALNDLGAQVGRIATDLKLAAELTSAPTDIFESSAVHTAVTDAIAELTSRAGLVADSITTVAGMPVTAATEFVEADLGLSRTIQ
jgi:hypothetical protein